MKNPALKLIIPLLLLPLLPSLSFADEKIKMTNSGICHGKDSYYYHRIKNEKAKFDTYEECFDAEGRPPKNLNNAEALEQYTTKLRIDAKTLEEGCKGGDLTKCSEIPKILKDTETAKKNASDSKDFAGFRFGVGIALTRLTSDTIDNVSIEGTAVNVNQERKNRGTLMLETHKFLKTGTWGSDGIPYGHGPFLAISVTDEEGADPLSSYGVGYMIGWKEKDSSNSWNVGIGGFMNTKATVLRGGLQDGSTTAITDSAKLTQEVDKGGWMIMFSTTW